MSKVFIGMPVYNAEKSLIYALDSLIDQTFRDYTILISDNCSTDRTREICLDYTKKYTNIKYFRQKLNIGPYNNFQFVLSKADAEYFMWAAADDIREKTYLEDVYNTFLTTPNCSLSFCDFDWIDTDHSFVADYPHINYLPAGDVLTRLSHYILQEEYLGKANPIYGLMKREEALCAFKFVIKHQAIWGVDMLFVFLMLTKGNLGICQKKLFHKVVSTVQNPITIQTSWLKIRKSYWSQHRDWSRYFDGYKKIINKSKFDKSIKDHLIQDVNTRWEKKFTELQYHHGRHLFSPFLHNLIFWK